MEKGQGAQMDNQTDNVTNIDVFGVSPYTIESSGGLLNTIIENRTFEFVPQIVKSEDQFIGSYLVINELKS